MDAVASKLNAFDVDSVVDRLREALTEEKAALLDDVECVQTKP